MKKNDKYSLLIDMAEGVLPASRQHEAEELLRTSPETAEELRLLRSTLGALGESAAAPAPEHYFSTLIPRVRERIASGSTVSSFPLPWFWERMFAPVMVAAVLFTISGLYRTFQPEERTGPIYRIVESIDLEEIETVLEEVSTATAGESPVRNGGTIGAVDPLFTAELLAHDIGQVQSEQELIARLETSEIDLVFDRLGIQHLP